MALVHHTTEVARIAIGTHAQLEGPRDYLEVSTALTLLAAAVLAAPAEAEPAFMAALLAQAAHDGLDAEDVCFMLMCCTLIDERDHGLAA